MDVGNTDASNTAPNGDARAPMQSVDHMHGNTAALGASDDDVSSDQAENARRMIDACFHGNLNVVHEYIAKNERYASLQDPETGRSPLMAASAAGNHALCQFLLERGAPWNAIDRQGQCAGSYATDAEHWTIVNLLVDWGVRSELILGRIERTNRLQSGVGSNSVETATTAPEGTSVEQLPSTKPDYLRQRLQYTEDGKALLDQDQDAVMMEWERPLMKAHAQVMMEDGRKRVLNVGFGMGIIDSALQELQPDLHIIIEAHPDVYRRMLEEQWDQKANVKLVFGRWQEVIPRLIAEKVEVDAIFFDTYGEHYLDLEDFHQQMVHLLSKPHGTYSFFNGLAPDNLFFHGVACQCVQLQLSSLGLDCEFLPCEIQVKDEEWEGVRRRYWHGRDTYYLPRAVWNANYLLTGRISQPLQDSSPAKSKLAENSHGDEGQSMDTDSSTDGKRLCSRSR